MFAVYLAAIFIRVRAIMKFRVIVSSITKRTKGKKGRKGVTRLDRSLVLGDNIIFTFLTPCHISYSMKILYNMFLKEEESLDSFINTCKTNLTAIQGKLSLASGFRNF